MTAPSAAPDVPGIDPEKIGSRTLGLLRDTVASIEEKLQGYSSEYEKKYRELSGRPNGVSSVTEIAGPITPLPVPYLWFDLMALGPFQLTAPGGPFLPHRVIRAGEDAFLVVALWRNPVSLLGGPSAAQIMAPYTFRVRVHTVNLNTVSSGPAIAPVTNVFGGGNTNIVVFPLPTTPAPPDGDPRLVEAHVTMDVLGPGPGLPPFAGFATRWFQPDLQPPFLGQPGVLPGVLEEIPVRFMIYN
ncbi:hypothetical protein [Streptomyces sp. HUAS ZL42]|uniref:hypothetical protein n=1 Tax=Streptomyces sp. HUAS ZL42 TaxID=3231715 RepID=UPI00345E42CD